MRMKTTSDDEHADASEIGGRQWKEGGQRKRRLAGQ